MTGNWFMLIIWLFVAAMSSVELTVSLLDHGFGHPRTYIFLALWLSSFFFIYRLAKLRNREKIKKK